MIIRQVVGMQRLRRRDVGTAPAGHVNHILTASESHFKMRKSMGLLYLIPCQPFVREGEGVPEGSVGGKVT
jgi:hypothetical protein